MPIVSSLASMDHKNVSRMSASREGFWKGEKRKERNSSVSVTIALAVCNYDFSLESKSNLRRVSRLYCAVPCAAAKVFRIFFPLPVWERLAFSLNGNYEGNKRGI